MSSLADMLAKARRAVMRRGVPAEDADELVHDAFIKVEQYERAHAAELTEALLVTAAVNFRSTVRAKNAARLSPIMTMSKRSPTVRPTPSKSSRNGRGLHTPGAALINCPKERGASC